MIESPLELVGYAIESVFNESSLIEVDGGYRSWQIDPQEADPNLAHGVFKLKVRTNVYGGGGVYDVVITYDAAMSEAEMPPPDLPDDPPGPAVPIEP